MRSYVVALVTCGVYELGGLNEADGELPGAHEVASPPVILVLVRLDALYHDQPGRVDGQDGIATPLGRQPPVGRLHAAAPGRLAMRLVMEIGANDGRVVVVVLGEHDPVADPTRLGQAVGVPQGRLRVGVGAVLVEE